MDNKNGKITKTDLNKVFMRNIFGLQLGWNYEKMQGLGYCYVLMPILRKLYPDKEDLTKAMQTHLGFFNTSQPMSNLIVGANVAMEEELGQEDPQAIIAMKAGLMGPFAGVGDTVFLAIYRAIVFSTAAYLALAGNAIGLLIPLICGIAVLGLRYKFTQMGYKQGRRVATDFATSLKVFTEAASILGITVIGALAASVVKATFPLVLQLGEVSLSFQEMFDKILPNMLPLGIVMFSYWLLGKKNMTSTKLIFVLIAIGILLGNVNTIAGLFA